MLATPTVTLTLALTLNVEGGDDTTTDHDGSSSSSSGVIRSSTNAPSSGAGSNGGRSSGAVGSGRSGEVLEDDHDDGGRLPSAGTVGEIGMGSAEFVNLVNAQFDVLASMLDAAQIVLYVRKENTETGDDCGRPAVQVRVRGFFFVPSLFLPYFFHGALFCSFHVCVCSLFLSFLARRVGSLFGDRVCPALRQAGCGVWQPVVVFYFVQFFFIVALFFYSPPPPPSLLSFLFQFSLFFFVTTWVYTFPRDGVCH